MHWFFLCLSIVWTTIFCCIFYLMVPDLKSGQTVAPPQQIIINICNNEKPQIIKKKKETSKKENPILLDKNDPPIELKVDKEKEISVKNLQKEIETIKPSEFEQRLVGILVKINAATCTSCSKDDKRILLQLKMMQALLEGKTSEALKINSELAKYVIKKKKKVEVLPPPL